MLAGAGRCILFSESQKPLPSLKRFARGEAGCAFSCLLPGAPGRVVHRIVLPLWPCPLQPAPSALGPRAWLVLTRGELRLLRSANFGSFPPLLFVSAGSHAPWLPLAEAGTN